MVNTAVAADELITQIIAAIEDLKGQDITLMDLRSIDNTVTNYFILCNGTSNTQVKAIVNSIQRKVSKELRENPWHVEGAEQAEWVLIDYVDVVIHVFQKHVREHYDLEGLWGDAEFTEISTTA